MHYDKKNPQHLSDIEDSRKAATYSSTSVVPSAQMGLTSLFGMVRGEPHRYNHLKLVPAKAGISLSQSLSL